jgi:glycine/D-amino acid oxidase-like deaminating enzyme
MIANSLWEKETYYSNNDVLIVGAGLMGLWTALELKKRAPKLKITIAEKSSTPLGASTRNAGFACFGSPTELLSDAKAMGEDEMWQIAEMRYKGIEKIKTHFTSSLIDYNPCGGFECLLQKDAAVLDELVWLNKGMQAITGTNECFSVQNHLLETLGLVGFDYLVNNKLEGTLHSGKLVQALTQKVQELGVQILYGATITKWNELNHTIEVDVNTTTIKTQQLIFCTNAFTNELLQEESIVPARGQILVTSPIENLLLNGSFHFEEGFYYWRNVGNRILLGGARNLAIEEETTIELATTNIIQNKLEQFLQIHIAQQYQYTIDHRWSGIMAFSTTKKPIFKQLDNQVYYAVACNGIGVALTPMFAEKIAKELIS